jgi:tetratricopeptide (TPR) repeat protein
MKAQEYYEKGVAYQNDGHYSKALICYDAATKLGLGIDNIVSYNIGISYLNTSAYDEAIKWLIESIRLNSDDAEAYCGLGSAYCNKKDYTQAIDCFEMAIRLKPDNAIKAMAYTNLGGIFSEVYKDYDKAIKYIEMAIKSNPHNEHYYSNLGHCYRRKGDYDKAIKCYENAIRLKPDFIKAYYALDIVYRDIGDREKANKYYHKAIELERDEAEEYGKEFSAKMDYFRNKRYLILNAAPKNIRDRTVNVITELLDMDTGENINPSNSSNCPPYIILCAMYPVFSEYYLIVDKNGVRDERSLKEVSSDAIVYIGNLLNVNDNTVYSIGAIGAQLFCGMDVLRKCGWA